MINLYTFTRTIEYNQIIQIQSNYLKEIISRQNLSFYAQTRAVDKRLDTPLLLTFVHLMTSNFCYLFIDFSCCWKFKFDCADNRSVYNKIFHGYTINFYF